MGDHSYDHSKQESIRNDLKPWTPSKYSRICSAHFLGNEKSNDPRSPSFNPTIHPLIKKSTSKKSPASFESQNTGMKRVLDEAQCIICGTFAVNTSYSKRLRQSSVIKANIFSEWKKSCAKATCEVLFDYKSGHFVKYFEDGEYCSLCEQLVRDICFTWKQLKHFENTIDNMAVRMCELIDLNYQQIPEKCNLNVMNERMSSYLSKTLHDAMPKFSHDEFSQIVYTVVNKRLQKQSNNISALDMATEVKHQADSDVEINSELEENCDLKSNSYNPINHFGDTNSGSEKPSQDGINKTRETLGESQDEETEYTLVEITPGSEDENTEDNVVGNSRSNPEDPPIYQCNICEKTFSCTKYLKFHHLKMHEDEKNLTFKCSFCDKRFALESWLVLHIRESHKNLIPPQSCDICKKTFETSLGLKSHIRSHKYEFKCSVCDKSFKTSLRRSAHEQLHSQDKDLQSKDKEKIKKKNKDMFECKYCSKGYNAEKELNSHYAEAHQGPNPFCCAFCPKIFSNSVDLQRHMKFSHPEPGSSAVELKCDVCERHFLHRHNLKRHKLKHGDPSLFFKCELCPVVLPSRWALNDHLKCHISEKKFICEICGKAFKTLNALKSHSKYHGEKQFPCKFCDKKFFNVSARKIHETVKHTNLKGYICQVCGRAFNHPGNLKGHLKLHANKGET